MLQKLIDFVFPPICPITRDYVETHGDLSPEMWSQLSWIDDPACQRCGCPLDFEEETTCAQCLTSPPVYDFARSLWIYNDMARRFILPFKHGDQTELAYWMTKSAYQRHQTYIDQCDLMIPVPLHRFRLLKRRYNQAGLLTEALTKLSQKPSYNNLLKRHRYTAPQSGKKADREKNIRNAFTISDLDKSLIKDKTILLVDDVYTTGATLNTCAKILKDNGAKSVQCLTIARVVF